MEDADAEANPEADAAGGRGPPISRYAAANTSKANGAIIRQSLRQPRGFGASITWCGDA
jgi:hypothetical protein